METSEKTVDELTKKLYEKADKKLHEAINSQTIDCNWNGLQSGWVNSIKIETSNYSIDNLLRRIREAVFESYKEEWRKKEVNNFVNKVDSMQRELDELKQEVDSHE